MSSTGESVKINVAVEKMAKTVEKTVKTVKKPATEKKAKVPKEKKPKTASHPTYFQMIKEALLVLKEKGGSSPHAIAKFMEEKHKSVLPENFRKMLAVQLKNSASKGKLTKVKASYKLSDSGKKAKAPAAVAAKKKPTSAGEKPKPKPKQTKVKKPAVAASTGGPKKVAKKTGGSAAVKKTKKMTPTKAKQPKSIKSPAAKKVRKVVA